jgi:hypothetical protein
LEAIVGVSVEKWMSNQKVNYEEEIKLCETLIRAKQKKEGQQNVAGAASFVDSFVAHKTRFLFFGFF